jgi:hypothetical protein
VHHVVDRVKIPDMPLYIEPPQLTDKQMKKVTLATAGAGVALGLLGFFSLGRRRTTGGS